MIYFMSYDYPTLTAFENSFNSYNSLYKERKYVSYKHYLPSIIRLIR